VTVNLPAELANRSSSSVRVRLTPRPRVAGRGAAPGRRDHPQGDHPMRNVHHTIRGSYCTMHDPSHHRTAHHPTPAM
jgi:hypothetical protein